MKYDALPSAYGFLPGMCKGHSREDVTITIAITIIIATVVLFEVLVDTLVVVKHKDLEGNTMRKCYGMARE